MFLNVDECGGKPLGLLRWVDHRLGCFGCGFRSLLGLLRWVDRRLGCFGCDFHSLLGLLRWVDHQLGCFGCGFHSHACSLGEGSTNHSSPRLSFISFSKKIKKEKKKKVEISSRKPVPLFSLGSAHGGSVIGDDRGRAFPGELRVSSFPSWVPHTVPGQQHIQPKTALGYGCDASLNVTCYLHFSQCYCGNTAMERIPK